MTKEERLKRLEDVVVKLCEQVTDTDYSWQSWADPLRKFQKQIFIERNPEEANKSENLFNSEEFKTLIQEMRYKQACWT